MSSKTNQKKAALSRRLFPNTKCQELLHPYLSGDFLAGECSLSRGNPFNFQRFKTLIGWNNSLALPQAIWFLSFLLSAKAWLVQSYESWRKCGCQTALVCRDGLLVRLPWGPCSVTREDLKHPLQSCPLWPHQGWDVVLLMCRFLGIFNLTELFKGFFLLATALVSPGDSFYNIHALSLPNTNYSLASASMFRCFQLRLRFWWFI